MTTFESWTRTTEPSGHGERAKYCPPLPRLKDSLRLYRSLVLELNSGQQLRVNNLRIFFFFMSLQELVTFKKIVLFLLKNYTRKPIKYVVITADLPIPDTRYTLMHAYSVTNRKITARRREGNVAPAGGSGPLASDARFTAPMNDPRGGGTAGGEDVLSFQTVVVRPSDQIAVSTNDGKRDAKLSSRFDGYRMGLRRLSQNQVPISKPFKTRFRILCKRKIYASSGFPSRTLLCTRHDNAKPPWTVSFQTSHSNLILT